MSMTDTELQAFHRRVVNAALRGYDVAHGDVYAAELAKESGAKGYSGSAKDLVALSKAVLAKRGGGKAVLPNKAVEAPKAAAKPAAAAAAAPPPPEAAAKPAAAAAAAPPPPPPEEDDVPPYSEWTRDELYEEAQAREIPGRSEMNKSDLIEALEANDAEAS